MRSIVSPKYTHFLWCFLIASCWWECFDFLLCECLLSFWCNFYTFYYMWWCLCSCFYFLFSYLLFYWARWCFLCLYKCSISTLGSLMSVIVNYFTFNFLLTSEWCLWASWVYNLFFIFCSLISFLFFSDFFFLSYSFFYFFSYSFYFYYFFSFTIFSFYFFSSFFF